MNKQTFLQQLAAALAGLPASERDDIIADYAAYFADAVADGRNEEAVAAALGDPQRLAQQLCAERKLAQWEAHKTPGNLRQVLVALAGLGVLNLLLAMPYLLLLTLLSSLWLGALSLLLAGLIVSGSWASHALFGWPSLSGIVLNDSGIGPWLIADGDVHGMPQLKIDSSNGEHVSITPDKATGNITIEARDGDEHFRLERHADGSLASLEAGDGDGRISLSGLRPLSGGGVLVVGLVLLLIGSIGSFFGWKLLRAMWQGTGRWLRWQRQLVQAEAVIPSRAA